ncbi:DUF2460 domain-containing protein [Parvularcula marina]|uniref:TIGR02217 family protein n=1 Tax=Parvularcula marina TaxID=2292771 RepID=A0A371RKN2_9PROT|nr:DUF2460 domain-containing protein [Parvularcula marina]RFB05936.1 TIGR02217 family protein [Parvularcula marina]
MAEAFHDVLFPVDIALGSRGGPIRRTEIVTLASGQERRLARWAQSRRRYDAGYGVRCRADIDALIAFFEVREGRRYAFRFRDPFDHVSGVSGSAPAPGDQPLGTGDGTETVFQLTKTYSSGAIDAARVITLPVAGTVRVAADNSELTEGEDFTLNALTGEVTFTAAPGAGVVLTAGFVFDTPVRFDTDQLIIEARTGGGDAPDIPLIEVRR